MDTHHLVVDFGRFKDQPWTRVPQSYLKYLVNDNSKHAPIALAELKRRGISLTQEIEVSGHAIDRASQHLIGKWMETRVQDEGLHAWLCRMSLDARARGRKLDGEKFFHAGMKFIFAECELWPVLVSIMVDRGQRT